MTNANDENTEQRDPMAIALERIEEAQRAQERMIDLS